MMFKKLIKWLLGLLGIYVIYIVSCSTFAHIWGRTLSDESKENLPVTTNREDISDERPDQVLLAKDRQQAFNIRIQLLRTAKTSVDIVYHTIHDGSSTEAFWGEVIRAADRGVSIRILIDGKVGASHAVRKTLDLLEGHERITCKVFNPVRLFRPWEWHTLLHDKFIIADNQYLLLGGRNLGDRYFGPEGYEEAIVHDWEVLVFGNGGELSVLPQILEYMKLLWEHPRTEPCGGGSEGDKSGFWRLEQAACSFEERNPSFYTSSLEECRKEAVDAAVTLFNNPVHTGQKEPWVGCQLKETISGSVDTVLIQTPYSTANGPLLETLSETAENAHVVMLTNSMASSPNYPAFSNYYYNRKKFLKTGAGIYEYQSSDSIHGKAMVMDGRYSAIGSFNLDDRSLYIDTETMLLIDSPEFASVLTDAINDYLKQSLRVGSDNQYEPSDEVTPLPVGILKRGIMFIVSLFSRTFQFLI